MSSSYNIAFTDFYVAIDMFHIQYIPYQYQYVVTYHQNVALYKSLSTHHDTSYNIRHTSRHIIQYRFHELKCVHLIYDIDEIRYKHLTNEQMSSSIVLTKFSS